MKFNSYQQLKIPHPLNRVDVYEKIVSGIRTDKNGFMQITEALQSTAASEWFWMMQYRPFYNIYPKVVDGICNTSLKVTPPQVFKKESSICVNFAKGHEPKIEYFEKDKHEEPIYAIARSMLCGRFWNGLMIEVDAFVDKDGFDPLGVSQAYFISDNMEIGGVFTGDAKNLDGLPVPISALSSQMKLASIAVGVQLLSAESDFCERILLSRDQGHNLSDEARARAEARALKRGVNGFTIGRSAEVMPHARSAHFAIRWTGKGGKIPKLRPVKASIVKRRAIESVPTGWLGNNE